MSDEVIERSMDEMFADELDQGAIDAIIERSLPPKGNYITNPDESPVNIFVNEFDDKDASGKVTGKRRMLTLTGLGTMLKGGEEHHCPIRLRLSPDARKAQVWDDGTPTGEFLEKEDSASLRWAEACKVYESTLGEKPTTAISVIEFLKSTPVRVYVFHGREGKVGFGAITAAIKRG